MRDTRRKTLRAVVAGAMLLLLGVTMVTAQTGPIFEPYSSTPVAGHGKSGSWDDQYTDPGAAFYYNGQFHMFRNGFRAWPASVQWGYVTSTDGLRWNKQGTDPVFRTSQVPYAGIAALASSVMVLDDGTWVIYFYTYGDGADTSGNWSIGRATAPAPTGPWKADDAPVLLPGPSGSWDAHIQSPSVVKTDQGYVMYYSGSTGENSRDDMIGMATSKNGLKWTKYNDPSTGGPLAESDPVFRTSEDPNAWDHIFVQQPHVVHTPQGWVMLYRSTPAFAAASGLGYALSDDGIHWTRSANNPVLRPQMIMNGNGIYFSNLTYQNDTFYVLLEVGTGPYTDVYVATHKGALPTVKVDVSTQTPTSEPTAESTAVSTPAVVPTVPVPGSNSRTFNETGKTVSGLFLDYWNNHGGLAQQGFPISGVMGEVSDLNGKPYTVQYFERAVFEYHPENAAPNNVLLSQLGTFQYKKKYPSGAPGQQPNNQAGSVLFGETGKRLGGKFLDYWKSRGGLAQQGFPISDEFQEKSDLDGKTYTVQYFERAVFELHPENAGTPYEVLLSQLGTFQYNAKYGGK